MVVVCDDADHVVNLPSLLGSPLSQTTSIDEFGHDVRLARIRFPDIKDGNDGGMVEAGQDSSLRYPSIHLRSVVELGQQLQCNKAFQHIVVRTEDNTKRSLTEFLQLNIPGDGGPRW